MLQTKKLSKLETYIEILASIHANCFNKDLYHPRDLEFLIEHSMITEEEDLTIKGVAILTYFNLI